jgi:phosphoadenosine phosphosulfate reductase
MPENYSAHLLKKSRKEMHTHTQLSQSKTENLNPEELNLEELNQLLENATPIASITWAAETFKDNLVMSTSFGIHSAVMLHLVTQVCPNIPVIWIDTGYLHPQTYQFAEQLTKRLELNLKIYQSSISPARMEAKYGKLWQQDNLEALNIYDRVRKVEPMQRALKELDAKAWIAGLRRQQTNHRQNFSPINYLGAYYKILPILNWTTKEIDKYLQVHNLPYHPLFKRGYVTVGDWHSSRPLMAGDLRDRDTRFNGLKQECGLH